MSRSRAVGLPSGPGPGRARSHSRYEPDRHDRAPSLPHQVRPQKSANFTPRERDNAPPMPRDLPPYASRSSASSYHSSNNSDSSYSSRSTFDRAGSGSGYASPATSYEDDAPRESLRPKGQSMRTRRAPLEPEAESVAPPLVSNEEGLGSSIWNRVAVAAGALTVNVSKAWASNIATMSGEETPPGQESRLTRAMKAYHLEKARELSDLPAWLFEEHERTPKLRAPEQSFATNAAAQSDRPGAATKSRGLRDIYDEAASVPIISTRRSDSSSCSTETYMQPSKATDRLRAIRDAKRTAVQTQAPANNHRGDTVGRDQSGGQRLGLRVGLPSGPVARTRRN